MRSRLVNMYSTGIDILNQRSKVEIQTSRHKHYFHNFKRISIKAEISTAEDASRMFQSRK